MSSFRPPMDTQTEFEPVEIAEGSALDQVAADYSVMRMDGEPDVSVRERTREAMKVRRAAEKIARGGSVIPPPLNPAEEEVRWLRERLRIAEAELLSHRATMLDLRRAAAALQWGRVAEILRR